MPFYLPIILGTGREGRWSEKVAKFVLAEFSKVKDVHTEIIDVRDFRLPVSDNTEKSEAAKRWEQIVLKSDGFIIVAPEYNRGYPGELKMMLDLLFSQYKKKPVGLCGVSSGPFGGSRMIEQLKNVVSYLGMIPVNPIVYFGLVEELFDDQGKIKDESYQKKLAKLFEELLAFVKIFKK